CQLERFWRLLDASHRSAACLCANPVELGRLRKLEFELETVGVAEELVSVDAVDPAVHRVQVATLVVDLVVRDVFVAVEFSLTSCFAGGCVDTAHCPCYCFARHLAGKLLAVLQ